MIIIDKNAKREVQVKYPDRTRVLFPNLDDGYISSNDVVIPGINAPISDDGVGVASINDGAEGNAISKLVIGIDPVQDLHGQSNPYPPGGGKNLIGSSVLSTKTNGNVTFTPQTTVPVVSLSGTSNEDFPYYICPNGTNVIKLNAGFVLPAGTYTFSATKSDGTKLNLGGTIGIFYWEGSSDTRQIVQANNSNVTSVSVTSAETLYMTPTFSGASGKATGFDIYLQLESGSSATAWSPYSNICPISGWTQAKVTRVGKNLFDASHTVNNKFTNSIQTAFEHYIATGEYATGYTTNGTSLGNNASYMTSFTPIKEDMEYVVKNTTSGSNLSMVCFLDDSGNVISHNIGWSSNAYVHTALSNEKYIMIGMKVAEKDAVIIAVGSTVPDVEPYNGQTYTIDLDGTIYGGTLDVTTGVLTVDRAMWTASASNLLRSSDNSFYSTAVDNIAYSTSENTTTAISDTFKSNTTNNTDCVFINTQGRIQVNTSTGYSSVANLISGVGTFKVLYQLATPITVQLTPQEVTTLLGQNNIWADCGDVLELSYSANMNIRLQDLLDEKLDKPTTPGTLGQVLTSDGEGGQTWETPE